MLRRARFHAALRPKELRSERRRTICKNTRRYAFYVISGGFCSDAASGGERRLPRPCAARLPKKVYRSWAPAFPWLDFSLGILLFAAGALAAYALVRYERGKKRKKISKIYRELMRNARVFVYNGGG